MRVHVLSSGLCQECQSEYDWKNGPREARRQANKARRMAMYEQGKKIIDKKWKEKYGDDSIEEVESFR
tara:strand:+ start:1094 stop:1297 length:204 start_codon:yes stop_codon:yes gene_type:complete